jgi:hypothetical protein
MKLIQIYHWFSRKIFFRNIINGEMAACEREKNVGKWVAFAFHISTQCIYTHIRSSLDLEGSFDFNMRPSQNARAASASREVSFQIPCANTSWRTEFFSRICRLNTLRANKVKYIKIGDGSFERQQTGKWRRKMCFVIFFLNVAICAERNCLEYVWKRATYLRYSY